MSSTLLEAGSAVLDAVDWLAVVLKLATLLLG